jgi:hypothetical protein
MSDPTWQGLFWGGHDIPFVQAAQTPLEQYSLVPHCLPSTEKPVEVQTGDPVVHTIEAAVQEPASLQSAPAAHATQAPALQTAPASQVHPLALRPTELQTVAPPSHSVTPMWQAPGLQDTPGVHMTDASGALSIPESPEVPASLASPESPVVTLPSPDAGPSYTLPSVVEASAPSFA